MLLSEAWRSTYMRRPIPRAACANAILLYSFIAMGCERETNTPGHAPGRTETELLAPTPSTAAGVQLPYKSLAMVLPQPLHEPPVEQAPEQYAPASPPWPSELTPVFGSELVERVKHSGFKGVLINAWATWCGPCKVEMPDLLKVREQYRARGIDVWFVSVDKSEHAEEVLRVLADRAVPTPHFVARGRLGYFKEALSPIWKGSLPSTFLFDGSGRVRYYWGAQILDGELTPLLDAYLAGETIDGAANYRIRRGTEAP